MIIDDDKPDYFVQESDNYQEVTTPAGGGRTIEFAETEPVPAHMSAAPRRRHKWLVWVVVICVVILGVAFYLRYLSPYATDCRMVGYVVAVEKRGILFKTYEADMISESALTDTTRVYSHNMDFSVDNPSVVVELQRCQGTGRPVRIVYEKYYGTLPWRGASKNMVTAVSIE
jgi:hypothetical protein